MSFFCLTAITTMAGKDTSSVNPVFRDSVLKNNVDSVKWNKLIHAVDLHKPGGHVIIMQEQKHPKRSSVFLYMTAVILFLLVLLRVIFDDFAHSLLEGLLSMKKFFIFYKTKKYDSFLAVLSVYVFKVTLLSLVVYIGLNYFQQDDFTVFHLNVFLDILVLLGIFFTAKNMVEFIFNWVIGMQETFNAFFLQNLFAEFMLSLVLLVVFLIYIYNTHVSYGLMLALLIASLGIYVVFNIVRSYQLIGNSRINYKLHFFLYICAFKILPFLILVKYILNNIV